MTVDLFETNLKVYFKFDIRTRQMPSRGLWENNLKNLHIRTSRRYRDIETTLLIFVLI